MKIFSNTGIIAKEEKKKETIPLDHGQRHNNRRMSAGHNENFIRVYRPLMLNSTQNSKPVSLYGSRFTNERDPVEWCL